MYRQMLLPFSTDDHFVKSCLFFRLFWITPSLWAQVNKQRPSSAYSLPLPPFSSSMGIFSSASVPFWVIIYQSTLLSKGILHLKTCICWLLLLCYWVTLLTFLTHLRCGSVSLVCLTCSTSHGHSYTWVRPTCNLVKKTKCKYNWIV